MANFDIGHVLMIRRRQKPWQRIWAVTVYASLGLTAQERHDAVSDMRALARQHGHTVNEAVR
jgi:hypothetical protein